MTQSFTIRRAESEDAEVILDLIRALADYEKLAHEVVATPDLLRTQLGGPNPRAHALLAEQDGAAIGFALYFYNFSTFLARPGIYLEDLFVRPEARALGVGKALLQQLAATAVAEGCGRLEWSVLDWNEPAIGFYKKIGARPMDEWTVYRMTGEALHTLAGTKKAA